MWPQGIVVAKLDRLSRSVVDFAGTLATARKQGWAIVLLDLGVDNSTPNGKLMAQIAEWERDIIAQRTKEALAEARARGVVLGRPVMVTPEVVRRIRSLRTTGHTSQAVADALNRDRVPTVHGGAKWRTSTVRGILRRSGGDPAHTDTTIRTR